MKRKKRVLPKLEQIKTQYLPFEEPVLYKIYNDGGHFIATRVLEPKKHFGNNTSEVSDEEVTFNELYALAKKENLKGSALSDFLKTELL